MRAFAFLAAPIRAKGIFVNFKNIYSVMGTSGYSLRTRRTPRATPAVCLSVSSDSSSRLRSPASIPEDKQEDGDFDLGPEAPDSPSSLEDSDDFFLESELEPDEVSLASDEPVSRATSRKGKKRQKKTAVSERFCSTSTVSSFSHAEILSCRLSLLHWYSANYRELPWRVKPRCVASGPGALIEKPESQSSAGAPYAIWVSEVMSQQTRISVVVEYWKRWMAAFPTIEALAAAPLERVNELWSGLGYYRRCKFLHEAAQQVIQEHDGQLPGSVEELLRVKGIGKYTAGAIASIAFNVPAPAVDGNVERVLARLRPGILPNREPARSPGAKAKVYEHLATELVADIETPGDFNQAIMELGATLCTPKNPSCTKCPVQGICGTFQEASSSALSPSEYAERYPVKDVSRKVKVREEIVLVCVVRRVSGAEPEYLLTQRPQSGLLAGLWESPNVVLPVNSNTVKSAAKRMRIMDTYIDGVLSAVGCAGDDSGRRDAGQTNHVFSHIRQTLHVQCLTVENKGKESGKLEDGRHFRWQSEADITDSAVATQMRKALKLAFEYKPATKSGTTRRPERKRRK